MLSPSVSGVGPQISRRRSRIKLCENWTEVYNSPEDTVDYWGELIRFCARFGSGCIAFGGKGIQFFFFFFFFFFNSDILLYYVHNIWHAALQLWPKNGGEKTI